MMGKRLLFSNLLPLADLMLILGCVCASPYITNTVAPLFDWAIIWEYHVLKVAPFLAGAAVVAAPIILNLVGFYRRYGLQRVSTAIRQLITFGIYYLCALALYQTLFSLTEASNHIVLVNIVVVPLVLFLRFICYRSLRLWRARGTDNLTQVLLVGTDEAVERGWQRLSDFWKRSLHVVGHVTPETTEEEVQAYVENNHVAQVLLFGGITAYHDNAKNLIQCELQGIDLYIVLDDTLPVSIRADITDVGDQRILVLNSAPSYSWPLLIKSLMDRSVALLLLICSLPIWLIAAIGIKISDPKGPIFYRQQRSGLYGKPFAMWKFRSMYKDAEQRLEEIKAAYGNEMDGPIFKLTNDPRIFPFGHFIRKFSIDELPQLLNVLKGDMSIVGPRPLPLYETAAFTDIAHRRRLSVLPGLTCFWQVEGRSENSTFDDMVQKDLKYIDNWSLWLDVKLFFRTIPAVIFGRGAK